MAPLVVFPLNGIGNRLRAIAASRFLAKRLKRPLTIVWEPDALLPGQWEDLFVKSSGLDFSSAQTAQEFELLPSLETVGLYVQSSELFISLRGNDRGEQPFADEYFRLLKKRHSTLGIVLAGDYFHHRAHSVEQAGSLLQRERRNLAAGLHFASPVVELARRIVPPRPYVSLHLRGTDRTSDATSPTKLINVAMTLSKKFGTRDIFVASDDQRLIELAASALGKHGLNITHNPEPSPSGTIYGTICAFADYLALRGGIAFVGGRKSTFSTEVGVTFRNSRMKLC